MRSGCRTVATGSSHMNRVSLPGLSLSAAVVVAALIALFVLESSDGSPAGYVPPPDGNAIVRLGPGGQIGVAGEQASSRGRKGRSGAAQSTALVRLVAAERARASALERERSGRSAPRRSAAQRKAARRRSASQRRSSGL